MNAFLGDSTSASYSMVTVVSPTRRSRYMESRKEPRTSLTSSERGSSGGSVKLEYWKRPLAEKLATWRRL